LSHSKLLLQESLLGKVFGVNRLILHKAVAEILIDNDSFGTTST